MPLRARAKKQRRHPALAGALLERVQDQLAAMRDRELGRDLGHCMGCGDLVRSQQSFTQRR